MNREHIYIYTIRHPGSGYVVLRGMFAQRGGILVGDYQYFMRQDESTPLSKGPRKLEERHERRVPKRS